MKCLNRKRIKLVNTEGLHSFSLRKVAAACGVSHAAPYSHFQSKEELLDAMQQYITDEFSRILEEAIQGNENTSGLLENMGIAYVSFFVDNPRYFSFIFSVKYVHRFIILHTRPRKFSSFCNLQKYSIQIVAGG